MKKWDVRCHMVCWFVYFSASICRHVWIIGEIFYAFFPILLLSFEFFHTVPLECKCIYLLVYCHCHCHTVIYRAKKLFLIFSCFHISISTVRVFFSLWNRACQVFFRSILQSASFNIRQLFYRHFIIVIVRQLKR